MAEFSKEERAAMKERAKELKASKTKADNLADLLSKIDEMSEQNKTIATKLHAIVTGAAPQLEPKTWYGQPAYALNDKVVLFFQSADKFNTRYCTLGFSDVAKLDDGEMWPTSYALTGLGAAEEKVIAALVKRAVGQS